MRIVVLLNAFWLRSGADIRAVKILCRWADAGHDIHVLAPRIASEILPSATDPTTHTLIWHCTDDAPFRSSLLRAYIGRTARALRVLSRFRRKWGQDFVLYSATDAFPDVLPCRIASRHGIRWVGCCYHIVENPSTRPGNRFWNRLSWLSQRCSLYDLRHADTLVVDNNGLRKELITHFGFCADRIVCHSCGVECHAAPPPGRTALALPQEVFPIVFCGRVKPSKGILDFIPLLQTLRSMRPEYRELRVGIIGSQEERFAKQVLEKAAGAGLSSVLRLLGPLETAERDALFRQAILFVSLSHEEGWGMAVAEALASALPVVAYDLPCYREAFPNLLQTSPPEDIAGIAKVIDTCLQNPAERKRLGSRGKEYVLSHYSYDVVAKQELNLFLSPP